MSMSTNQGGLRQNLPKTFQDNAPNGGRPQTMPAKVNPAVNYPGLMQDTPDYGGGMATPGFGDDNPMVPVDPGFNANQVSPGGKGGGFGPGMTPGSPGGKAVQPIMGAPRDVFQGEPMPIQGEAPPDQGFIRSPKPTLPPQMQKPMPGPGYIGGIRTPPNNYRPPNQGGGILRSRRTGMPINR